MNIVKHVDTNTGPPIIELATGTAMAVLNCELTVAAARVAHLHRDLKLMGSMTAPSQRTSDPPPAVAPLPLTMTLYPHATRSNISFYKQRRKRMYNSQSASVNIRII